jgi:hypothetical protein
MKRATAVVGALALLLLVAWLFRREPLAPRASQPEAPAAAAVADPEPIAAVAAPAPPPPRPRSPGREPPPRHAAGTGILRGTVKVLGEPPRPKRIKMVSDPKCVEQHSVDVLSDALVVDPDGGVKWAFVYIDSRINPPPPKGPSPPILIDQVGCRFVPHVLGVQVGQPLNIYNNDKLLHNVRSLPFDNKEFNIGLTGPGEFQTVTFNTPEVMIKFACDLHPWMRAWVGVLDHPYFAVTGDTGAYGIPNLPAGHYTVKAWQEVYATVSRAVDIPPGGDIILDFILDARKQ